MDRDKREEHVKRMTLISAMLRGGADLPLVTINFGVEYAKRLSTDNTLRTDVAATFNPSLADRDFKRAAQVVQKYSSAPFKVHAGKPDLGTRTPPRAPEPTAKATPPLAAVKPEPVEARKDTFMRDVPYEQTEAGYAALGNYWREFKHEPPNDFNLKEWAYGR